MSGVKKDYVRPIDFKRGCVDMSHGSGGKAMAQLIDELFLRGFDNQWLREMNDQARFAVAAGRMVMATDSHVVSPLFFPGGDIVGARHHQRCGHVRRSPAISLGRLHS
jgi:hydrogenase expression/formation protein HypE